MGDLWEGTGPIPRKGSFRFSSNVVRSTDSQGGHFENKGLEDDGQVITVSDHRHDDLPPFVVPLAMLDQPPRPSDGAERKQATWASLLVLEAGIPANCAV